MPSIQITDSVQGEIITANPIVNSGFGKYLTGIPAQVLAGTDVASQFRQPLQLVQPGTNGFGFKFQNSIPLGSSRVALSVNAGAQALISVHNRSGKPLFEDNFIGDPLNVPGGKAYVSFLFHPSVSAGLSSGAGALSFGFRAGTEIELRCSQLFDLMAAPPTLAEATKTILENFVIPGDLDDLRAMPQGAVASVSGHGVFQVGVSVDFAAALNPLASLNAMTKLGKVEISAGATLSAGFTAKVTGDYQIRVHKSGPDTIRLSYHKVAGGELGFDLEAKAGPGLTVGKRDLLKTFLQKGSTAPAAEITQLVDGGLSNDQIDQFDSEIQAGMRRTLNLSLSAEFCALKQNDSAFLYEFELSKLDDVSQAAVLKALSGDLTALNLLEPEMPARGVRVLETRTGNLRQKRVRWRINLLGIVNVLSLTELVRHGTVIHDPESGELAITDEITSKRIGAVSESKSIRKAIFECAMLSATYKASGVDVNSQLKASQSFFALDQNTNQQKMADFLDGVAGLGLITFADRQAKIEGIGQFGSSTVLLETDYDQQACEAMFLDEAGNPRPVEYYERAGRNSILSLVQAGDPEDYRRVPVDSEILWQKMKAAGQFNFRSVLPAPITGGAQEAVRVSVVIADFTLITWWAGAMTIAAGQLFKMRKFLAGADAATLKDDPAFRENRTELEDAMAGAIKKNKSSFGDPWGLLAMFNAANGTAEARATVTSPKVTLFLP